MRSIAEKSGSNRGRSVLEETNATDPLTGASKSDVLAALERADFLDVFGAEIRCAS